MIKVVNDNVSDALQGLRSELERNGVSKTPRYFVTPSLKKHIATRKAQHLQKIDRIKAAQKRATRHPAPYTDPAFLREYRDGLHQKFADGVQFPGRRRR